MAQKTKLAIRIDQADKEQLEAVARRRGMDPSEAAREALALWVNLDDDVLDRVKKLASSFTVPIYLVIQNFVWGVWAEWTARLEVYGGMFRNRFLDVFFRDSAGEIITGDRYTRMILQERIPELLRQKQMEDEARELAKKRGKTES